METGTGICIFRHNIFNFNERVNAALYEFISSNSAEVCWLQNLPMSGFKYVLLLKLILKLDKKYIEITIYESKFKEVVYLKADI